MPRNGLTLTKSGGRFSDLIGPIRVNVADAVAKTAEAIEAKSRVSILTGPKTGKVYKRHGVEHQASAEGEAPANDVGTLAGSIAADTSHVLTDLTAPVIVGAEYAGALEAIEEGDVIKAPRPFMEPAVESEQQNFDRRLNSAFDRGIR